MDNRFSVMERQWVGGAMRLIVMDWKKGEILTFMLDDLEEPSVDQELVSFIKNMRPILEKPLWKSSPPDKSH